MKKEESDQAEAGPPASPRPFRRRLKRLFWLLAIVGLLSLIGLAGLGFYGFRHRVQLINSATSRLSLPYDISVGDLNFLGADNIQLSGIELRERGGDRMILHSDNASWNFDVRKLTKGDLGAIVLDGAQLAVTPEDVALFLGKQPDKTTLPSSDSASEEKSARVLSWDSLSLRNLDLNYSGDETWPQSKAKVDLEGESLTLDPATGLVAGKHSLKIRDLVVGSPEETFHVDLPKLQVELEGATTEAISLTSVDVTAKALRVDLDDLARRFPSGPDKPDPSAKTPEIRILNLLVANEALELSGLPQPVTQFSAGIDFHGKNLVLRGSEGEADAIDLKLLKPSIQLPGDSTSKALELILEAGGSWGKASELHIVSLIIDGVNVDLNLTDLVPPTSEVTDAPTAPSSDFGIHSLVADSIQLIGSKVVIQESQHIPHIETTLDLETSDWKWADGQLSLPSTTQQLSLESLTVQMPGQTEQVANLSKAVLQIDPKSFYESGNIQSLTADRLDVDLRKDAFTRPAPSSTTSDDSPSTDADTPAYLDPARWSFANLAIAGGSLLIPDLDGAGVPFIRSDFALSTEEESPAGIHRLQLNKLRLSAAEDQPAFYKTESASADLDYRKIWTGKGIENVTLKGGVLELGEKLDALTSKAPANQPTEAATDPTEAETAATNEALLAQLPSFEDLVIKDTRIILQDIAPGLPTVAFGLEKRAGRQRIELVNLEIPSPYNTLIPVARLETIFVEFTLEGLLAQRIDKVEIVSPTIFVGEHLFWYVEHYRDFGTDEDADSADADAGWDIGEIAAHNGNIVIAPKGTALPGFEIPFPFSCRTQLGQGVIEAKLNIQSGDYPIPDLELILEGLSGSVAFNLPLQQVDNNLVEVLRADRLRYKQFVGDNPYVTLTYDQAGVYVSFGAEAYSGYINGEFNVYIDENYSWDGWVAGTGVDTEPLTDILTPEYFDMTGIVDVTVVANGTIDELFQAKGTFTGSTGGKIDIRAMEGLAEQIEDPDPIVLWMADAGVNVIQHFRYENADGKFNLYGREGELGLILGGPDGRREFEVVVHDHRPVAKKVAEEE